MIVSYAKVIPVVLSGVSIVHPILQQVQWYTEREAKLAVESEFLETKEVFANVFGEVTANELLAAVIEGTSSICANIIKGRSKKFGVVSTHSIMHANELGAESLNIILDVCL